MSVPAVDSVLDEVDVKPADAFGGRVIRKDLVKKTKVGFNVPIYMLEYLLGRYCSSTDSSIVAEGLEHVNSIIAERFVRADEGELIKSRTRERGSMRLIDRVTVTYGETEDKYWVFLANSGLSYVHIAPHLVQQYEKLLVGGVWANVEVRYDDNLQHRGVPRPFAIEQLQPIQIASADLDGYIDGRRHFTRDEWIDVLVCVRGHFRLGNHVEERDRKAIVKTVSGLLNLFHPDSQCAKAELEQYLSFAIEMRRGSKSSWSAWVASSTPRSTCHTSTWKEVRRRLCPAPSWA